MSDLVQKKVFAALPRAERGKPVKITGDSKGENFLYCNGNSVFIRNLQNPSICDIYTEHSKPATVARYSPSRFYIASCDSAGKIRIWDTVNPEHVLKYEYQVLGGEICDVSWDPNSKKIAVCGQGREKFAHVFNVETGTSVGEILGHIKAINTISYRNQSPFRIVTASEDMGLKLYEGLPFKLMKSVALKNFGNVARFIGDGSWVVSGGADGKLFKHDGLTLDETQQVELGAPQAHKGGIYDICFSPDNKEVLTASGDKTAKIFNVESGEVVQVFDMGKGRENKWENMQLGCLWQEGELLTVNPLGHITYHDRTNPEKPKRVIKGHMKPITTLALSANRRTAFTAGQEGIIYWDVESGDNGSVCGKGHQVIDMVTEGDSLFSVGIDDTLRVVSVPDKEFIDTEIKLDSQPRQVDSKNGKIAVACINHVVVLKRGDRGLEKVSALAVKPEPSSVSVHPNGTTVAVGFPAKEVRIYSLQNGTLSERKKVSIEGEVSCLAFSPDGRSLAYGASKKVGSLSTDDYEFAGNQSDRHTARVMCVGWSPDSQHFASGSLDSSLIVWPTKITFGSKPTIKAHTMSYINKLAWLDPVTIITAGQDANVKQFSLIDGQQQQQQQAKR